MILRTVEQVRRAFLMIARFTLLLAGLARALAAGATSLVLTARRKNRLEELARKLTAAHNVHTEVFPADLADSNAPEYIFAFTKQKGIEIELLINNAGFGQYGEFHSINKQRLLDMVQVNCHAVVHLTRLYLPEMVAAVAIF